MVDLTWCIVFLLPFPWHRLTVPERDAFAFALHDCTGRSITTNRAWIETTLVRQAQQDELGFLTVISAWPSIARAEGCRRYVVAAGIHAPVRVECLATLPPAASWWNQTCMADRDRAPSLDPASDSDTTGVYAALHDTSTQDTQSDERVWFVLCSALFAICTMTYLIFWVPLTKHARFEPPTPHTQDDASEATSVHLRVIADLSRARYLGETDADGEESVFSPYGSIRDGIGEGGVGGDGVPSNSPSRDKAYDEEARALIDVLSPLPDM